MTAPLGDAALAVKGCEADVCPVDQEVIGHPSAPSFCKPSRCPEEERQLKPGGEEQAGDECISDVCDAGDVPAFLFGRSVISRCARRA